MYREFYGLNKKPFQISADPEFLWLGPKHKEGLSVLLYGVRDNRGFLVLSGGVGTGKTTLIHALNEKLDDGVVVASVPDPGLALIEFYRFIAASFGMEGEYRNKVDFLLGFEKFLKEVHTQGRAALLIIDEAQRLSSAMLEEVRLLSNIETPKHKLLNIFFVGQEEFYEVIATPQNRALRQRVTINYHLDTLSLEETRMLIAYRLKVAGATKSIFNDEAIAGIYNCSKGHPRRINILCDHALLTGFVKNCPTIGADIITECSAELALPGESFGLRLPSAVATGSLERDTHQVESKTPQTPNPPAPAIPEDFVADETPKPAAPRRKNHRRLLMIATTICLFVLAAMLFFKPQRLPTAPSLNATIAAAPNEGTAQAETTPPALNVAVSSSPDEPLVQPETHQDTSNEVPASSESISIAPIEQITTEPQEEAFVTANQTPRLAALPEFSPDFETETAPDSDLGPSENDILAAPSSDTGTAPAEVGASTTMAEDMPETLEATADQGFLPESASEDSSPSTIENIERATVDMPTPTNQDLAHEEPAPREDPEDLRFAKATPGSPLETADDNEVPSTATLIESDRSDSLESSDHRADSPSATRSEVSTPPPRPSSETVQPDESVTVTSGQKEQPSSRSSTSGRTDSPAPTKSAMDAPEKPRPESAPQTPRPQKSVAPKPVERKPLVAAATAKAPLKDDALTGPTTTKRLEAFLQAYCRAYSAKDLNRFTAFFTSDATEHNKPFAELIPIYRANFEKLDAVRYQINMQTYKESANGREIQFKGDFQFLYRRDGQGWRTYGGLIEMDLVKINDEYRIKRLDYQKRK